MAEELRSTFHRELQRIDARVTELFALVGEGVAGATDALLAGDREGARVLMARDELIDSTYRDIEELVQLQLSLQQPVASDLRLLLCVLRIVPELERSGDLAEHIAQRAARGVTDELTPRIRGLIGQMGRVSMEMWRSAADAYVERDPAAATVLNERDDELDDLHVSFISEVSSGEFRIPVAIELALLGRFYERLGDHAVNVAYRVCYLATGVVGARGPRLKPIPE